MTNSTNFGLGKLELTDTLRPTTFDAWNNNVDKIDTALLQGGKPLTSPVRIWGLADGCYVLPAGCVVYYYGATNTSNSVTINTTGFLIVTSYSTTYKNFYILRGNSSSSRYITNGYSTSSSGASTNFNLGSTYLTSISSYVKDNLTYATSGTSYALSAYQGKVLNDTKQNKITYSTTDLTAGTSTLATGELYVVYE